MADELPFFEVEVHLEVLADGLDIGEAVLFEHSPYGVAESLDVDGSCESDRARDEHVPPLPLAKNSTKNSTVNIENYRYRCRLDR